MNGLPRDLVDMLEAVSKPADVRKKKKSDGAPQVPAPDQNVAAACARYPQLLKALADLEQERLEKRDIIAAAARAAVYGQSRYARKAMKSVSMAGVTYSLTTKKFKVGVGNEAAFRAAFGPRFDEFLAPEWEIKVDLQRLTPEALAALAKCGILPEKCFRATDALYTARLLDPAVQEKCEELGIENTGDLLQIVE